MKSKFGDNMRRFMKAAGMNGRQLAARLQVTPPTVSAYLKGRNGLPETPNLLKIAKALRVSVDDLLVGVDADYDALRGRSTLTETAGEPDAASHLGARVLALPDDLKTLTLDHLKAAEKLARARQRPRVRQSS